MNDRQRTEAILFPLWMLNIMECGARDKSEEDFKVVRQYLVDACDEIMRGSDEKRMASILRRATRLHDRILQDHIESRARVDKVGLIAMYVLKAILDSDYLCIDEGSNLSIAVDAILAGLEEAMREGRLDASARKQAARTLRALQAEGYFEGVIMEEGVNG